MYEEIIMTFDDSGNPIIEAKGFKGKTCVKEVEDLLRSLGGKTTNLRYKPEYYQHDGLKQVHKLK